MTEDISRWKNVLDALGGITQFAILILGIGLLGIAIYEFFTLQDSRHSAILSLNLLIYHRVLELNQKLDNRQQKCGKS